MAAPRPSTRGQRCQRGECRSETEQLADCDRLAENKDPAYNGQRGFGCTGAHVHWNWAQDDFRKTILNAIVWIARMDVPSNGVESKRPTAQDLLANMDKKKDSGSKSEEWIENHIKELNQPKQSAAK